MTKQVVVDICGVKTTVPLWHYSWCAYIAQLTRQQFECQRALSEGQPRENFAIFAEYWKNLSPE